MHRLTARFVSALITIIGCSCSSPSRQSPAKGTTSLAAGTLNEALAAAEASSGQRSADETRTYNAATERATVLWLAQAGGPSRRPLTVAGTGRTYTRSASWPEDLLFDELIPALPVPRENDYRDRRAGVGANLVARWHSTPERKAQHPFMAEAGFLAPVTATLDFKGSQAILRLHDPRPEQTAVIAGRTHMLSSDSGAVSRWVTHELKKKGQTMGMSGIKGLLKSADYMDKIGILSLEPVSSDRIPVIMAHGLLSRPLTWDRAYTELSADPVIARKYQFFFFRYPSGVPVAYSAARCRASLAALKKELDRKGNHIYRNRMILIGHSMGGLVSKSQVQSSGDILWKDILGGTPEELKLSAADVAAFRPLLEFTPNPDVSRVVFVCTPHRGSELAGGFLGKLGRRLIELPMNVLGDTFSILQGKAPDNPAIAKLLASGVPSSVENLSPKSRYVQEAMKLPIKRGLHIHSIIGNEKGLPLDDPKCSDGLVPYWSSHLDGVDSELLVRSGHSAQEKPETVDELRRILLLHAGR